MLSTIIAYSPKIPALILASELMDKMGHKKLLTTFTPIMSLSLISLALALTTVSFPTTLKPIGRSAFFHCSSLENVDLLRTNLQELVNVPSQNAQN